MFKKKYLLKNRIELILALFSKNAIEIIKTKLPSQGSLCGVRRLTWVDILCRCISSTFHRESSFTCKSTRNTCNVNLFFSLFFTSAFWDFRDLKPFGLKMITFQVKMFHSWDIEITYCYVILIARI